MTSTCAASLFLLLTTFGLCSEPLPNPEVPRAGRPSASADEPQTGQERARQQTPTARTFMLDHALEAFEMRRAAIAGRFDLLHRASGVVASDAWSPRLRPEYLPHVTAVRNAARAALDATSVPAAGAALGNLGEACASCHRAHGGPPPPQSSEILAAGVGAMAMHAAAEQAMWEGLFTPSEASWKRGAERLAQSPEIASAVEDVPELAQQLRDLALEAASGEARGALYGRIVATCSTCHRRLNIEPR
jgi:cytochrome c556